jgi:hypothetical protein
MDRLMAVDLNLGVNDLGPALQRQLGDDAGSAFDLTGVQGVFFNMVADDGTLKIDHQPAQIVDAAQRIVRYDWQTGDTDTPGMFFAQFVVVFSDGRPVTFPNAGPMRIEVTDLSVPDTGLIPLADLDRLLAGGLSEAEQDLAGEWLLPTLIADAEEVAHRRLTSQSRRETDLFLYPGWDFVRLHHLPVTDVASVTVDGIVWPAGTWSVESNGVRLVGPAAGIPVNNPGALIRTSKVTVTYTGGLSEAQAQPAKLPITMRAVRIIAKVRDDQLGLDSLTVDQYHAQYASEGWTVDEERTLTRIGSRIRVSALQNPTAWPPDAALESWSDPITS